MGLLIRGGEVVTALGRCRADVWCEGETVTQVAAGIAPPPGAVVVEAAGKWVLPGFIDPHVHAYLPLTHVTAKSDYANCTRAALMGGTTCILDFAGAGQEKDFDEAWAAWEAQAAGKASCDYGFHLMIKRFDDGLKKQLERLVAKGLKSVKIYLAYKPALAIGDEDLYRVLEFAAAHDLVVLAHCENADLIPAMQKKLLAEGKTGPEWHEPSRPPMVEAEGVCTFLTFAAATGAKAYVVHLSCAEALSMADRFRGKLKHLYIETMIQYLTLDKSYAERPDFEGAKWVLSPPLREKSDQDALWAALADGRIDTLGTDHCPFDFKGQKELGRGNFAKIPNGLAGVEERVALAYTAGVLGGKITLEQLVKVAAENPAKIFGLWGRKGTIAPGFDADLVVWDPAARRTISVKTQSLDQDYNAYEGFEVRGAPEVVTVRGEIMVRGGKFVGTAGKGRLLL
ncbi:MAG: dihydropyrimidinase [Opitutae bacterium]|nr:dihydropyrimidinase [Opitutae bacterium]